MGPFWSREEMGNRSRANHGNAGYEAQLKNNSGQNSKMYILGDGNCLNRNFKQRDGNHEKEPIGNARREKYVIRIN